MAKGIILKPCWSCGEPGQKKKISAFANATNYGDIIDTRATCSNEDCEFNSFVYTIDAWNTRTKVNASG